MARYWVALYRGLEKLESHIARNKAEAVGWMFTFALELSDPADCEIVAIPYGCTEETYRPVRNVKWFEETIRWVQARAR